MTSQTFTIPLQNLGTLREKLAHFNKKGGSFSLDVLGKPFQRSERFVINGDEAYLSVQYVRVDVAGLAPPVVEGWRVIGVVERLEDDSNLVFSMPGITLPEHFRHCDHVCDHCKTKRDRKRSFVLQHDNGDVRMIGRSCLSDYLGHPDAAGLAQSATHIARVINCIEDAGVDGDFRPRGLGVKEFLRIVVNLASRFGFEKADSEAPTARLAIDAYFSGKIPTSDSEVEIATAMLEWITSTAASSEFLANLKLICSKDYVELKHASMVAALYPTYLHAHCKQGGGSVVPVGRNWVEGQVVSIKCKHDAERGGWIHKMLVADPRGFRVYGTIPNALVNQVREGCVVKFKGTLSHKEPGFGFFSRPSNTQVVASMSLH